MAAELEAEFEVWGRARGRERKMKYGPRTAHRRGGIFRSAEGDSARWLRDPVDRDRLTWANLLTVDIKGRVRTCGDSCWLGKGERQGGLISPCGKDRGGELFSGGQEVQEARINGNGACGIGDVLAALRNNKLTDFGIELS